MWKVIIYAEVELISQTIIKKHYKKKTQNISLDMEIVDGIGKTYHVYLDKDYVGDIINEGEQIAYWLIEFDSAYAVPHYAVSEGRIHLVVEVTCNMKESKIVTDTIKKRKALNR